MAALPYMQLYVADYLADTAHLSTLENGAYLLLIFNYWQRGECFKAKDQQSLNRRLASVARMSNEEWENVKESLSEFFETSETEWKHPRIDRDLEAVNFKSAKASAAGKASAASKSNKRSTNVEQTFNHTEADTDTEADISTPIGVESAPKRASRLSADLAIPDEWAAFCKAERPDLDPASVFSKFKDYWLSKPGKAGTKLDWFATWRNWVREERAPPKPGTAARPPVTAAEKYAAQRDAMRGNHDRTITGTAVRVA